MTSLNIKVYIQMRIQNVNYIREEDKRGVISCLDEQSTDSGDGNTGNTDLEDGLTGDLLWTRRNGWGSSVASAVRSWARWDSASLLWGLAWGSLGESDTLRNGDVGSEVSRGRWDGSWGRDVAGWWSGGSWGWVRGNVLARDDVRASAVGDSDELSLLVDDSRGSDDGRLSWGSGVLDWSLGWGNSWSASAAALLGAGGDGSDFSRDVNLSRGLDDSRLSESNGGDDSTRKSELSRHHF